MMNSKITHFFKFHQEYGRLVDFAGFKMPLWYEGIIPEHLTVRNSVGIFDITHMCRVLVTGEDSPDFLNFATSNDISQLTQLSGLYSLILNEEGGIIDDITIFKLKEDSYLLVCNAVNHDKDIKVLKYRSSKFNVNIKDISYNSAMIAVQGPKAVKVIERIYGLSFSDLRRYGCRWAKLNSYETLICRLGYTGEDGFEIYIWNIPLDKADDALRIWNLILKAGKEYGIKPCGLGARDTLRIEAGYCLYDNDISEEITPLEAKLDFAVSFDKGYFIGKDALMRIKKGGISRVRVGIKLVDRGIPRSKYKIYRGDEEIGVITSGTYSPLLKCGIALGYVAVEYSEVGTEVEVDIRGRRARAIISETPFYDKEKYGWNRKIA